MYHRWLDRWDENRARRADALKQRTDFVLDADLAFPGAKNITSMKAFCALADSAVTDPRFFDEFGKPEPSVQWQDEWISFPSDILTNTEENNTVTAKLTKSWSVDRALVIFHHWNATSRNPQIAKFFSRRGITVAEMAMPYHFERRRAGSLHAEYMLSPNLGRTLQSMRQAVLDGRRLIRVLKNEGYGEVSVLGISLGSWVAGLIAAHDTAIEKAALLLTAGSLADMVWTGRATEHIRASLEGKVWLAEFRRAWSPLNLENHAKKFARTNLDLRVVLAKRDTVILPELSKQLIMKLETADANPSVLELNCGHYSLSLPPYVIRAGLDLKQFLTIKS